MSENKNAELVLDSIKTINDWKIQKLKANIESKEVIWFLGAGISVPFNIPLWDNLLKRMWTRLADAELTKKLAGFEKKITDEKFLSESDEIERSYYQLINSEKFNFYMGKEYKDRLKIALEGRRMEQFDNLNLLEFAEYINNMIIEGQELPFETELKNSFIKGLTRNSLYANYNEKLYVRKEKEAVGVLARYLLSNQKKGQKVITYNYDEVLEKMLMYKNNSILGKMNIVSERSGITSAEEKVVDIYHVHGFLPKSEELKKYESKGIILAESSYDEIEKYVYNWVNTVQANAFQTSMGIFLGFSGQDHNFRRILKNIDVVDEEETYNFMFVAINSFIEKCKDLGDEKKKGSADYEFERRQLIDYMHAQEIYWKKYNIFPIWTTYKKLPEMLKEILNV